MRDASWRWRAGLSAYEAAWVPAAPLVRRYLARRARRDPGYAAHMEERDAAGARFPADIWIHAVSMGEMRSAVPLVRALLDRGHRIVTTHLTPAGRRAAEAAFGAEIAAGRLAVRFMPYDRAAIWRRFLAAHDPRLALVLEIEVWPAMIEAARGAGVPLWLVNSQVPERSFARARALARTFGHPVARAAGVAAKSDRHAARFRALGAARVEVTGELRFDQPRPAEQIAAARALRARLGRPVVTIASAVAGEDDVYLDAIARLRAGANPAPFLVHVPRAPERFDEVAERLGAAGLRVLRRSRVLDADLGDAAFDPGADVLLGNSLGEMYFYLAMADLAIVGGGFVPKGAHNVIEPLSLGLPVLVGPHVWTIEFPAYEAQAAGVLEVVPDAAALADEAGAILRDPAAMAARRTAAHDFAAAHEGATARTLAVLPLSEPRG